MAEVELPNTEEPEEARSKKFTRRVALITAIFAVLLAVTSLGGNNAMKEMLLAQQQSADQWAFYQSKVVREHLYKIEKLKIEADLFDRGKAMKPEVRNKYELMLKDMAKEEARYNSEKTKIEEDAKHLEKERDINRIKDPYFDFAEVCLQIAIVMASISILSLSRLVFYIAAVFAVTGTLLMVNGYLLIFRLPFPH